MTAGDWDEPKKYFFSVPLMNTEERAIKISEKLNTILNIHVPFMVEDSCKVSCHHDIQVIEVSLCCFQLASAQNIVDAVNSTFIDATHSTCFQAFQTFQVSQSYFPSSNMGISQNFSAFSNEEDGATYSSDSDDVEHYWSIVPTL